MPHPRALIALAALCLPALALAADPAHGDSHAAPEGVILPIEQGVASGIMAVVAFLTVLFILSTQVWPKITKALDERAAKIRDEIAAAEMARKQAKSALDEYERSLADARKEAQRLIESTRADQGRLAAELRAKAEAELADLRARATAEIDQAKRAALSEIYDQSVQLATMMASRILQREIGPQDQRRLLDESLTQLAAIKRN